MTRTVAIVQARMGSERLPGKMLASLDDRPLVDYALSRLMTICGPGEPLDAVVLATSVASDNDPLVQHVEQAWPDIPVVRGDEQDVLSRFVDAMTTSGAEYLVRITGDCPLINVGAVARMLAVARENEADVVNYQPGHEYVDKGVEVVSARALQALAGQPDLPAHSREHVTSELYRHPDQYRVCYVESEPALRRGDVRLTVDTAEDLRFFRALARYFSGKLIEASLDEVLAVLEAHPELSGINANAGRKSSLHEAVRIGFRCDGGSGLGMGHVVGCVRMARLLADSLGWGAEFVCRRESVVRRTIQQGGFAVEQLAGEVTPEEDVNRLLEKVRESDWSAVVINFGKQDLDRYADQFSRFRAAGVKLVFMDNPVPPGCYEADLLINALPHPDYPGYDPQSHPRCLDGLAYFLPAERLEPVTGRPLPRLSDHGRILVAMGGGDVGELTRRVLEGIAGAGFQGEVEVILGGSSGRSEEMQETLRELSLDGTVAVGVSDMAERMKRADLGFTGLGLTTYEMAYVGLPALIVANSPFNATVAEGYCQRHGLARLVGAWPDVSVSQISAAVTEISDNGIGIDPWITAENYQRQGAVIGAERCAVVAAFRALLGGSYEKNRR